MTSGQQVSASSRHQLLHESGVQEAVAAATNALRSRGDRVTVPRQAVLEVLAAHPELLTADEVVALLDEGVGHRATVYRTLELLTEAGVVTRRLGDDGAIAYHLTETGSAHAHLHGHCRVCGSIVALPVHAFDSAVAQLRAAGGFTIELSKSTFTGVCEPCQQHS